VIVAPSLALLIALWTSPGVEPAGQLHVVPLPVQAASAPELVHQKRTTTRIIHKMCIVLSLNQRIVLQTAGSLKDLLVVRSNVNILS
jgi:hypothetical protein